MRFMCDVFNKIHGYCDTYMVVANNRKDAREELENRLEEETDEGAKGWDIIRISGIIE